MKPNKALPEYDQDIDLGLRELLRNALILRDKVNAPKTGCACVEQQICAHHAAIYRHLDQVRKSIHFAIDQIEKEM